MFKQNISIQEKLQAKEVPRAKECFSCIEVAIWFLQFLYRFFGIVTPF